MAKLAQLPASNGAAHAEGRLTRLPRLRTRYYAFLSYSHRDKDLADWLHRELERFRVPHSLAGKLTANGVVPRRLTPIFRDQQDLSAGADLGEEIKAALAASQFLLVLCSPEAAKSRWTNAEIESFKRTRPEGCVLAAVVGGEPFATDMPGREAEECFPPALRYKYDRRGHQTAKRAEPLAADFRDSGDGRRLAFLKLVAGMLGVALDDLVQRESVRRHRRMAWLAAGSLSGMVITSALAVTAIQSRNEAREQRRQAEGLVGFMLGDLKDKLEPIGRLDALDAVGSRALAYYQHQDKSELSDDALAQRSRALTLMGEIANTRGDLDGALGRYREAMASTDELARRYPNDPQRLFDHAQNVFWVGEVAHQRGQMGEAERAMRAYKGLADSMVAIQPENRKWQLEVKYANSSLAALLYEQRHFPEASRLFQQALKIIESLGAAEPGNADYKRSTVETLGFLSDSRFGEGLVDDAIAARERQTQYLETLISRNPGDASYRLQAIPANWALGRLLAQNGNALAGVERLQKAVSLGEALLAAEPTNSDTIEYTAGARFDLAGLLAALGRLDAAAAAARAGCDQATRLLSLDQKVATWQRRRFECSLTRGDLALRSGAIEEALMDAQSAVVAAETIRKQKDTDGRFALGRAYNLIGNIRSRQGDKTAALASWRDGLAIWPRGTPETPSQSALRMRLLKSTGATAQAAALKRELAAKGFREVT